VVASVGDYRELRPPEILRDGGLRHVHLAVGHLKVALVAMGFSPIEDHEASSCLGEAFGEGLLFRQFDRLLWLPLLSWWLGDEALQELALAELVADRELVVLAW
jgi:hypothetical protein